MFDWELKTMNYISIQEVAKNGIFLLVEFNFFVRKTEYREPKKLVMFGLFQTISVNLRICEKEKCMENLYSL